MDDPASDVSATYVDGLAAGEVIQLGTGDWRDGSVKGVAVSEAAFDILEPAIRTTLSDWSDSGRYGVTDIPPASLATLIEAIGALSYDDGATKTMIAQVTDWLTLAHEQGDPVSIFGI